MLLVKRDTIPAPAALSNEQSTRFRETLLSIFEMETTDLAQSTYSVEQQVEVDDAVLRSLRQLFGNRCAFCETPSTLLHVYRFRPSQNAGPPQDAPPESADRMHLYYMWLVNDWSNLYPICDKCLDGNPSYFPVTGKRTPLPSVDAVREYVKHPTGTFSDWRPDKATFLDPCGTQDLRKHLSPRPNGTLVTSISQRGDATIDQFNLNRRSLVEIRRDIFDNNLNLLSNATNISEVQDSLFGFSSMDHGGVWFLLLYQIARRIGGGGGGRPTLSQSRIVRYYADLIGTPDFGSRLREATETLLETPSLNEDSNPEAPSSAFGVAPRTISIFNFKALENLHIALPAQTRSSAQSVTKNIGNILVILGENAAGKSSVLEAITLALTTDTAREDISLRNSRFILKPELMGGHVENRRQHTSVTATYSGDLTSQNLDEAPVRTLRIGEARYSTTSMHNPPPPMPVYAYGAFRLFLNADKRQRASARIRSLFDAQYVLPNPEIWMSQLSSPGDFEEVARIVQDVISASGLKYDLIEADREEKRCYLVRKQTIPNGGETIVRTPFRDVSSGYRAVIGMVCDILRGLLSAGRDRAVQLPEARAIVLIDEIEAHLHPIWKMQILHTLRKVLPNVLFIVTTHDPLCLRGLQSTQVKVLRRARREDTDVESGGLPEFVEQLEDIPSIGKFTLDQLLTSDLFGMFSTEDPTMGRTLAEMGDILAHGTEDEIEVVTESLRDKTSSALPLGTTQVEQLVLQAVQAYLIDRRKTRASDIAKLDAETRANIVSILKEG